jgi:hypothetical protein
MNAQALSDPMAIMQLALEQSARGEWREAAENLSLAATLHHAAGRTYDEARCRQFAATLMRFAGDQDAARDLAKGAAAVECGDLPLKISIEAEQAEQARADGRLEEAHAAWTRCLAQAEHAGLGAPGRAALLSRRAEAATGLGRFEEAVADLDAACALCDAATAQRMRAAQANHLLDLGQDQHADRLLSQAEASDAPTRAALSVPRARLARRRGDLVAARRFAEAGRAAAREAVAPVEYFSASAELAEALDASRDHVGAYGALASCWATLGDLLGRDVARAWVEPCLSALRLRWGDQAFFSAKADYEAARRAGGC